MIWKTPTSPLPRELLPRNQHATHHQASEKDRTTWPNNLKIRAVQERTTVGDLIEGWVEGWP